jgi:hypothetical protein
LTFITGALAWLLSVLMLAVPATTWPLVGKAVVAGGVSAWAAKLTHKHNAMVRNTKALLVCMVSERIIRS